MAILSSIFSAGPPWGLFALLALCILVARRVWYAFFGPLSHFPGPRLASLTGIWEMYYDIVKNGKGVHRVMELHQEYSSSIVRIRPDFLHISDPDLFDEIISAQDTYPKDPTFYSRFGIPGSMITETDPVIHHAKRKLLESCFKSKAVEDHSPKIQAKLQVLYHVLKRVENADSSIDPFDIFARLSWDLIYGLSFNEEYHYTENFDKEATCLVDMKRSFTTAMYFKWIPGLCALVFELPLWFVGQTCGGYVQFRQHAAKRVQLAYARIRTESDSDRELPGTIFDDLLRSYAKQSKDFKLTSRQLESLVDEVFIFLCAGTDTTAIAIAITIVCLCQNPTMMAKLREEVDALKGIPIQEIDAKTITRMPYLDAVIYEGLRIGSPIATYLPRFVSTKNANLGGHYIPRGTKLGINFDVIHRHPKHYPEPDRFIPERWLGEEGKQLHKWFVAFSKGPRRCIGMHLALHEMKLTIAVLVSKFDISMVKPNATLAWRSQMSKIYTDNLRIKVKEVV